MINDYNHEIEFDYDLLLTEYIITTSVQFINIGGIIYN